MERLESGTHQDLLKADGRYAELLIYKQEVINNKMIIFLKNLSLIKLINKHKLVEKQETEYFLLFLYCLSIFFC
jgi:ABC-type multidrug transport system fused ATPase/permease subunit